jgi:hypothetical protein
MRRWLGVVVLMVFVTIFAVQNDGPVRLTFLFWHTPRAHLALLLALAFCAGAATTGLVTWQGWRTGSGGSWWPVRHPRLQRDTVSIADQTEQGSVEQDPDNGVAPSSEDTSPSRSGNSSGSLGHIR